MLQQQLDGDGVKIRVRDLLRQDGGLGTIYVRTDCGVTWGGTIHIYP